jgi:hypothetical protein
MTDESAPVKPSLSFDEKLILEKWFLMILETVFRQQ